MKKEDFSIFLFFKYIISIISIIMKIYLSRAVEFRVSIYIYRSMAAGFSIYFLKTLSHLAPTAPSTTRWSQDKVTVMKVATLCPLASSGTTLFSEPPTANIQALKNRNKLLTLIQIAAKTLTYQNTLLVVD